MSIRPSITLLFILSVLTLLLILSIVFPENGIEITDNISLKFVQPAQIFSGEKEEYADIDHILELDAMLNDSVLAKLTDENTESSWDTVRANADSLRGSIPRLQFPKGKKKILYPVFAALDRASSSRKTVRIMHYGDSQIEGDRITSFLRNKWQKKFGGMGVGLIPVQQVYDFKFSIFQENSDNWLRYTLYGKPDTTLGHKRYGALASFTRFSPYESDKQQGDESYEAWVNFTQSPYSYSNTKHFQQCKVFYSHNPEPFIAEIYQQDSLLEADMYPASSSLRTIRWSFNEPISDLKIVFKGNSSPEFYGIALDGLSGVAVDNIAMRGNSGLIFDRMDREILRTHYKELNTKLIILQFGGNVVPHITSSYDYYERLFSAQIRRIKQVLPDVVVIVIGVADMSIKENSRYVTYPNLEKVRDALKNASLNSGAIYWDMYKAMGGKNSMPSWVFANPPLASKDFVHFNPRGAKLIANMFYNAFMYEYSLYKKNSGTAAGEVESTKEIAEHELEDKL